jgi:ABC-2 type transport system permease protein
MHVLSLVKKELRWSRRNIAVLVLLLVVLPGVFAYASVAFEHVLPRDAPIAIVAQDDAVERDELEIVQGGITTFSDPHIYESRAEAMTALTREQVYAIIEVPPDLLDESQRSVLTVHVDGSMVPFKEPSKAITGIVNYRLQTSLDGQVSVERVVVGNSHSLSEYLLPIFLFGIVLLFAFTYVPYNLAAESNALARIRAESSLEALVASKLLFFLALFIAPIGTFKLASLYLGYQVAPLAPLAIVALLATFLYLTTLAIAVMILTNFSTLGRFLNVVFMFAVLTFGGLMYPVGFFSPLRRELARLIPVHYSMILVRSGMLRGATISAYLDWLVGLAVVVIGAGIVLELAIVRYRRHA